VRLFAGLLLVLVVQLSDADVGSRRRTAGCEVSERRSCNPAEPCRTARQNPRGVSPVKPGDRVADKMNMNDLASLPGGSSFPGRQHQCHAPDRGDVELEALAPVQPRCSHHFHLGQLIVPIADTVDGLRAEDDVAPVFTDFELRGRRHATKYIASVTEDVLGGNR
jgi:hypothetical protein